MEAIHDFRSSPVPVRLTCQYSNGITLSYYARALMCDGSRARVLTAQYFENSVKLNVLAPFLRGMTACCVSGSQRNASQPWLFEIELQFLTEVTWGAAEHVALETETPRAANFEQLSVAAADLAERLSAHEEAAALRFSEVWKQLPAGRRPDHLVACVPAVQLLLQDKGWLDLRALLNHIVPPQKVERAAAIERGSMAVR